MFPVINIFGINIPSYGVAAIFGIVLAVLYIWLRVRRREDIDHTQLINIPAMAFIGAFIGAHILYGITHLDKLWWCIMHLDKVFSSWKNFWFYTTDIWGGMVFYGGLIGGIILGTIYCKKQKLDTMFYADIYAPAIPLFHAFGRVGCFLGGCCYGIESSWGVVYNNPNIPEANGVTRLPIQLVESAGDLIIFAILLFLSYKNLRKGTLFLLYLLMYGALRMTTEFFRGDEIRGFLFGISTSQWISIILIICSLAILIYRHINFKQKGTD